MSSIYDIIENYEYAAPDAPVMISVGGTLIACTGTSIDSAESELFFHYDDVAACFVVGDVIHLVESLPAGSYGYELVAESISGESLPIRDAYLTEDGSDSVFVLET